MRARLALPDFKREGKKREKGKQSAKTSIKMLKEISTMTKELSE